jgi:hypothetical protein
MTEDGERRIDAEPETGSGPLLRSRGGRVVPRRIGRLSETAVARHWSDPGYAYSPMARGRTAPALNLMESVAKERRSAWEETPQAGERRSRVSEDTGGQSLKFGTLERVAHSPLVAEREVVQTTGGGLQRVGGRRLERPVPNELCAKTPEPVSGVWYQDGFCSNSAGSPMSQLDAVVPVARVPPAKRPKGSTVATSGEKLGEVTVGCCVGSTETANPKGKAAPKPPALDRGGAPEARTLLDRDVSLEQSLDQRMGSGAKRWTVTGWGGENDSQTWQSLEDASESKAAWGDSERGWADHLSVPLSEGELAVRDRASEGHFNRPSTSYSSAEPLEGQKRAQGQGGVDWDTTQVTQSSSSSLLNYLKGGNREGSQPRGRGGLRGTEHGLQGGFRELGDGTTGTGIANRLLRLHGSKSRSWEKAGSAEVLRDAETWQRGVGDAKVSETGEKKTIREGGVVNTRGSEGDVFRGDRDRRGARAETRGRKEAERSLLGGSSASSEMRGVGVEAEGPLGGPSGSIEVGFQDGVKNAGWGANGSLEGGLTVGGLDEELGLFVDRLGGLESSADSDQRGSKGHSRSPFSDRFSDSRKVTRRSVGLPNLESNRRDETQAEYIEGRLRFSERGTENHRPFERPFNSRPPLDDLTGTQSAFNQTLSPQTVESASSNPETLERSASESGGELLEALPETAFYDDDFLDRFQYTRPPPNRNLPLFMDLRRYGTAPEQPMPPPWHPKDSSHEGLGKALVESLSFGRGILFWRRSFREYSLVLVSYTALLAPNLSSGSKFSLRMSVTRGNCRISNI